MLFSVFYLINTELYCFYSTDIDRKKGKEVIVTMMIMTEEN